MKRALALSAVTACLTLGVAPAAHAGEVTGNGKPTAMRGHAASECAFSGLDDADVDPVTGEDDFGRTQNYGQIPAAERQMFHKEFGFTPGQACPPAPE